MKDRISLYPGRVMLTPVAGQENIFDVVRADEPQEVGTPLNKANLLTDDTATMLGLDPETATPNDAFNVIAATNIKDLVIKKIVTSQTWVAPKAKNQLFKVFCVGGGGGGGYYWYDNSDNYTSGGGGGSGYIEIADLTIAEGTNISIVCGAGGASADSRGSTMGEVRGQPGFDGGTTTFGPYLSAAGGKAGKGGASNTSSVSGSGGDGEAGGGGGRYGHGGNGRTYGGGGGAGAGNSSVATNGGNGGTYGGGGGGGYAKSGNGGTGGTYGGKGGKYSNTASNWSKDGAPFSDPFINVLFMADRIGTGKTVHDPAPNSAYILPSGGGGYGGDGGASYRSGSSIYGSGGGGGYGGNGGGPNGVSSYVGGGGGGYCGNGGSSTYTNSEYGGGGGGGFFCNGGSGKSTGGGGGGFFDDGKENGAGGNGGVLIMYFKED